MKRRPRRKTLQVVMEDGEPSAVIVGIDDYRDMIERLEDVEDLKLLERMRDKPLKFKRLEEFLVEYSPVVS